MWECLHKHSRNFHKDQNNNMNYWLINLWLSRLNWDLCGASEQLQSSENKRFCSSKQEVNKNFFYVIAVWFLCSHHRRRCPWHAVDAVNLLLPFPFSPCGSSFVVGVFFSILQIRELKSASQAADCLWGYTRTHKQEEKTHYQNKTVIFTTSGTR